MRTHKEPTAQDEIDFSQEFLEMLRGNWEIMQQPRRGFSNEDFSSRRESVLQRGKDRGLTSKRMSELIDKAVQTFQAQVSANGNGKEAV